MEDKVLGVKIDYIRIDQAVETVKSWLQKRKKCYVVTPNPEMIVDAQGDKTFKLALNEADLAIPDSPRLGWASTFINSDNPIFRLIYLPFFIFPKIIVQNTYPTTTGVDLMEELISLSEEKAYTTAYLGGSFSVADKLLECLRAKHPKLKIAFCSGNIKVRYDGQTDFDIEKYKMTGSKSIKSNRRSKTDLNPHILSQKIDILFVGFGHKKQEKWMYQNLPKLNTKVMIGVGGAFDYLSGSVPRAPLLVRELGFEWLFRFIIQPWRIKRFWKLPVFLYKVMTSS